MEFGKLQIKMKKRDLGDTMYRVSHTRSNIVASFTEREKFFE